ncbi:MAG: hypothetical protein AAFY34_10620 [Pseudomonadota bacterium]
MGDLLKAFGITIAFVVPGMVLLLAFAFIYDDVEAGLMYIASDALKNVGGIILIVVSVAFGLVVHVLAWFAFEIGAMHLYYKLRGTTRPSFDIGKAFDTEDGQKAFDYINEQTFRYHQFFGSLSMVLLIISFLFAWERALPIPVLFVCLGTSGLLAIASVKMMISNHNNLKSIFPVS